MNFFCADRGIIH
jgi:hypothetical protein